MSDIAEIIDAKFRLGDEFADYAAVLRSEWEQMLAAYREQAEHIRSLEEVLEDNRRLAREIDVAMHGEENAAKQPALCDLVLSARDMRAELAKADEMLKAVAAQCEAAEREVIELREKLRKLEELEPVDGDVLPPVGSTVWIRHGRDDEAHPCIVTGYYAWPDLDGNKRLHRVFVRVTYRDTSTPNARMLCDVWPTEEAALSAADPKPAPVSVQEGWLRAVDNEMITLHLGVANAGDDYETAQKKLHQIIDWHVSVALDPAVNGGKVLVPEWQPIETAPKDGTEFQSWWEGQWEPRCRFNPETDGFEIWGRVDYDAEGWERFDPLPEAWMPQPAAPQPKENSHD